MGFVNLKEIFPNKFSIFIFITYIFLFLSQAILVTKSQNSDNQYNYNVVTVILLTEFVKLILSILMYCKNNGIATLCADIFKDIKLMYLYFIPASLYCFYNNLSFKNLSTFDPTTYYLLLQLRVVVTGVLFQIIFKKVLSRLQWVSLVLLTLGCMLKQVNFGNESENPLNKNIKGFDLSLDAIFILVQILCSCFAGVYNEYLLKRDGANVNIYIQNIYMYVDSILCNMFVLMWQGDIQNTFNTKNLEILSDYIVVLIILNNAVVGIVTSLFLKTMNSILKTFASALEILFVSLASYVFLGIAIGLNTLCSIIVVSYATVLYSRNPVNNNNTSTEHVKKNTLIKSTV